VDGHDLHSVDIGGMGLGDVLLGLFDEPQVVEEGGEPGIALDGREALGQVEEPQQVLTTALARRLPEARPLHDRLGQVEHGKARG
jgi:hypothetical protein